MKAQSTIRRLAQRVSHNRMWLQPCPAQKPAQVFVVNSTFGKRLPQHHMPTINLSPSHPQTSTPSLFDSLPVTVPRSLSAFAPLAAARTSTPAGTGAALGSCCALPTAAPRTAATTAAAAAAGLAAAGLLGQRGAGVGPLEPAVRKEARLEGSQVRLSATDLGPQQHGVGPIASFLPEERRHLSYNLMCRCSQLW